MNRERKREIQGYDERETEREREKQIQADSWTDIQAHKQVELMLI